MLMMMKKLLKRICEYKQMVWLGIVIAFSIVLLENLYLLEPFFNRIMKVSDYLSWHILFEFISILISFSVFILPFYAYRQNHRLRGIIIANVFLIMGIIDVFHTLSFKGMPDFLIENSFANRATTFWIIARLAGAIGIVIGSFIKIHSQSKVDRKVFLAISVLFPLLILVVVTYFPNIIPAMYIEGAGLTPIKIVLEYIVILFLLFAGIMFMRQYLKYKDRSNLMFTIAIATSIFSELSFVSYSTVYDIYNYIGHVYKFISYFIVFRIAFINNIERPYRALYEAKNRLKEYNRDLNLLVSERTVELQTANHELNLLNQKLLDDLEYARDIQKAILPAKLPNNEQVTFEAKYYPAERVSGDFYNIFRLDENRIGMYIGDVSGHGVPAAMLTIFINQSIKTTKELARNRFEVIRPSKVLDNLYELYNKVHFRDELYILVLYAIYNTKTKELEYSSAGLNVQPLVVKKNNQISEIDIKGLPICSLMHIIKADYTDHKIQLENGDRVLFYTDGLIELNNKKTGETFTMPQLKEILVENNDKSCLELFAEIDNRIKHISDISRLKDDVTFLILQVN